MQPYQTLSSPTVQRHDQLVDQHTIHVKATKGLSIAQLLIGIASVVFGLALVCFDRNKIYYKYRYDDDYDIWKFNNAGSCGIVCGTLVAITGILGVISFKDPANHCKNGVYMGFCILSIISANLTVTTFAIGLASYDQCWRYYETERGCLSQTEIGLSAILLGLGVVEFFVALVSAILTCAFGCCGPQGCCCKTQHKGTVYQHVPHQQQYTITSTSGSTVTQQQYPSPNAPPQQGLQMSPACASSSQCTTPYIHDQLPMHHASGETSNRSYATDNQAPPPYEMKPGDRALPV